VRLLSYCVREAAVGMWRQRGSTVLSALTIMIAMAVLGLFLVVSSSLDRAVATWGAAAEFTIYLRDDITAAQRAALEHLLADSPLVASRAYVSKADALDRFSRDFPDLASSARAAAENPLPASIDVRLRAEQAVSDEVASLATRAGVAEGVADVRYDREWLGRLARAASFVSRMGWALGLVLVIAASLTVTTVVRLSLHARRDEVDILQLMGAPVRLLRGPLVAEGTLHGGLGSAAAVLGLAILCATARAHAASAWPSLVASGIIGGLPWSLAFGLVVGGMAVGCLGGLVASRQVR